VYFFVDLAIIADSVSTIKRRKAREKCW